MKQFVSIKSAFVSFFLFVAPTFAFAATLSVSPSSGSFAAGNIITVQIQVNTQGSASDGVDIQYLNFSPSQLQVIDENASLAGVQIVGGSLLPNTPTNSVDNATGRITFSQVPVGGTTFTNSSSQTIATVRFTVVGTGTASVTFSHISGSTADSNVAAGGSDLLTSVTNGSYTLAGTNNPPTVSAVSTNVSDVDLGTAGIQYYEGTTVTYSGSASDLDGDTLTWIWLYAINGGSEIQFSTGTGAVQSAVFTYGAGTAGSTYRWILRVTDGRSSPVQSTLDIMIIAVADTVAPVISNIAHSNITTSGVTIAWTTNEPADSQVEYGVTTSYGSLSSLSSTRVTSHSISLVGLSPSTLYNYRVRSRDAAGNLGMSLNRTFTTQALPDTSPPNPITGASVSSITTTSALLSWTAPSDLPGGGAAAGYDIRYSTTPLTELNFASATAVTGEPTPASPGTVQTYVIAGLNSSTPYYVAIKSQDSMGNVSLISNVVNFTTQALVDTTAPTISITSPLSNDTVAGTITVTVNATDNVGVVGVQFLVDGTNLGAEDTSAPYSISWNTGSVLDGSHILTARARDAAGNTTMSGGITVNVLNNPPPSFDFSLSNDGNKGVAQGASVANTITAALVTGTARPVSFSVSGLPGGATGVFLPVSCNPGCSSVLTITTLSTTPAGAVTVTVTGVGNGTTRTTTFQLSVTVPPSTKFRNNDRIAVRSQSSSGAEVRSSASISASLLTTQPDGTLGTIIGGPVLANGFHWWQIDYDITGGIGTNTDGWSVEDNLEVATFVAGAKFAPHVEGGVLSTRSFTVTILQRNASTTLFTFTSTPDVQQEIPVAIATLLEGTYDLLVFSPSFLREKIDDVVITSSAVIALPVLRGGDFNNDGVINEIDWSFMNPRWFSADATADLNGDGVVNSVDFSYMNKNWNAVGN